MNTSAIFVNTLALLHNRGVLNSGHGREKTNQTMVSAVLEEMYAADHNSQGVVTINPGRRTISSVVPTA
jgi:hypothetical protein